MSDGPDKPTSQQLGVPEANGEKPSGAKLIIELAPLLLFFIAYARTDIKTATGVLVVATLVSLLAAWKWLGHISPMMWVASALVCFFGTLTFLLDDPRFIKMKPTAVNLLFAGALAVGLAIGKPFLKIMLGEAFRMTDVGWRKLTIRWMLFFVVMAMLNEFIWRTMAESTWVNFKVFAILPLSIAFTIAQMPLMARHSENARDQ